MSTLRFGQIQTVKFFGQIQALNSFVSPLVCSKKANFKKKLSALGHFTVNKKIIAKQKKEKLPKSGFREISFFCAVLLFRSNKHLCK
jgi:hypothetical protein